jgi:hypothetical protein
VVPSKMLQKAEGRGESGCLGDLRHHLLIGLVQAVEPFASTHIVRPRSLARRLSKHRQLALHSLFDGDEPDYFHELFRSHVPSMAENRSGVPIAESRVPSGRLRPGKIGATQNVRC